METDPYYYATHLDGHRSSRFCSAWAPCNWVKVQPDSEKWTCRKSTT